MYSHYSVTLGVLLYGSIASAQSNSVLPLERLRLYDTGVGYFERQGTVHRTGSVHLLVPTGHLDDALKTLVVLDSGNGTSVSSIDFDSSLTPGLGRARAGLSTDAAKPLSMVALLRSLRGARVEATVGGRVLRGRLIDAVSAEASQLQQCVTMSGRNDDNCTVVKSATTTILGENGEIRRLAVEDLSGVRPLDPARIERLRGALSATHQPATESQSDLRVVAEGGESVKLGYITETPVWRTTYRIVVSDTGSAKLHGWALVHNDTDEAWRGVELELVNGEPDTFLFPLAAPRYARREVRVPERQLATTPQLVDSTVDAMWGDKIGTAHSSGGLGLSGIGEGGGGRGHRITLGKGAGKTSGASSSSPLLPMGSLARMRTGDGVEAGTLFRYILPVPVNLAARSSALLPLFQEPIKCQPVTWFRTAGATARSALHLANSTSQTLPAGVASAFMLGGFAGESTLPRLKPKEETIVQFGNELDVELEQRRSEYKDNLKLLRVENRQLVTHFERRHLNRYMIKNRNSTARTVYLDLNYIDNASVSGADALGYDTVRKRPLAIFEVEAQTAREVNLHINEGRSKATSLARLTPPAIGELARTPSLPDAQRALLNAAYELSQRLQAARQRLADNQNARSANLEDIERFQAEIRALRDPGAAQPFVARMDSAEKHLTRLKREHRKLTHGSRRLEHTLKQTLQRLNEVDS